MMQKIKDHLDKIVAALLIVGCLVVLIWRLMPSGEQAINANSIETTIGVVAKAFRDNKAPDPPKPDYVGVFVANLGNAERALPQDLAAWKFFPRPPYVMGFEISRPREFYAGLSQPKISSGGVWVGRGTVHVAFGKGDDNWQSRALLVWRKPVAEAKWPAEPMLIIKPGTADSVASLPPNVTAAADGFELRIEDLAPRTPYEFRVCTAATFPARVKKVVLSKEEEGEVKLPDSQVDFLPVSEDLKPRLQKLLDAPGVDLLKGAPFLTRFSEVEKLELPSDVQIRLNGMETDDDGKYFRGSFAMRRWIPAREKWVEKTERIEKGKDIRSEKQERVDKELITYPIDASATLVDLDVRNIEKEVEVEEYQKDPKTGAMKLVKVKKKVSPERVQVATIRDKHTGQVHTVLCKPDEWWPKGLQIFPKGAESRTTGSTAPGTTPAVVTPEPRPVTTPPTTTPKTTPPTDPGPGPGTPPTGIAPGIPPGVAPGSTPGVPPGMVPGTAPGTRPGAVPGMAPGIPPGMGMGN